MSRQANTTSTHGRQRSPRASHRPPGRPPNRTSARVAAPWVISLVMHGALIALGVLVTWSVIRMDDRIASPVVTADATVTPVAALIEAPVATTEIAAIAMPDIASPPVSAQTPRIDGPGLGTPLSIGGPTTAFAGASLGGAMDVVFVLDASGSMIAWLPFIIDEVERTLHAMSDQQRFAIIRFAGDRVEPTPPGGLERIEPAAIERAIGATRRAAATAMGGGSDPVPALERALAMRPDLVLLLSEGLDGRGRFAVDRAGTLKRLAVLNPADAAGDRPVRISCIRLVASEDDSPSNLLEDIAATHSDAPVHLVTPEELDP